MMMLSVIGLIVVGVLIGAGAYYLFSNVTVKNKMKGDD